MTKGYWQRSIADTEQVNSAARIAGLLFNVQRLAGNARLHDNWAQIFGILETEPVSRMRQVMRALTELQDEIDLLDAAMAQHTTLRPPKRAPIIDALRKAAAFGNLENHWSAVQAVVGPEVIHSLDQWADLLPPDERRLDPLKIDELQTAIVDVIDLVRGATIDPELKAFMLQQLYELDLALRHYDIHGMPGVKKAAAAAIGTMGLVEQSIPKQSPAASAFRRVVNQVWTAVKVAAVVGGLLDDAPAITRIIGPIGQALLTAGTEAEESLPTDLAAADATDVARAEPGE